MTWIYKPFGIILGLIAGLLSRKIFDAVWAQIDDEEAPKGTTKEVPLGKKLGAAALQGIVFKSTRVAVNHYSARGFYHMTGVWPGKDRPMPK